MKTRIAMTDLPSLSYCHDVMFAWEKVLENDIEMMWNTPRANIPS